MRGWVVPLVALLLCLNSVLVQSFAAGNVFATVVRSDAEVLLARVLMHTVETSGNPKGYPRYIFAHDSVSRAAERQIRDDGVIFQRLKDARFSYSAMFNVSMAAKVLYLAPQTLVMEDLSGLFECGDFCAAFVTTCSFHPGVLVIKPNATKFDEIMKMYHSAASETAVCGPSHRPDGLDREACVLNEMFGVALFDAPLFRLEDPTTYGGELKRLPFGCNVNHVLYYPRLRFELSEQSCGKLRVIDFLGPSYFHPDKWWTYALLSLGDKWVEYRQQLRDPSAPNSVKTSAILSRLLLCYIAFFAVLATIGLNRTYRLRNAGYSGPAALSALKLDDRIFILAAVALGLFGWILSVCLALIATPPTLMPFWACVLFFHYKAFLWMSWMLFCGSTFCASQATTEEITYQAGTSSSWRAIFETIAFGVLEAVYPVLALVIARHVKVGSIYERLLQFIPVVAVYILLIIVAVGRISLAWVSHGSRYGALSLTKVWCF